MADNVETAKRVPPLFRTDKLCDHHISKHLFSVHYSPKYVDSVDGSVLAVLEVNDAKVSADV